jgi:hypothetical protein
MRLRDAALPLDAHAAGRHQRGGLWLEILARVHVISYDSRRPRGVHPPHRRTGRVDRRHRDHLREPRTPRASPRSSTTASIERSPSPTSAAARRRERRPAGSARGSRPSHVARSRSGGDDRHRHHSGSDEAVVGAGAATATRDDIAGLSSDGRRAAADQGAPRVQLRGRPDRGIRARDRCARRG